MSFAIQTPRRYPIVLMNPMNDTETPSRVEADGLSLRRLLRMRTHESHERLDRSFEGMTEAATPDDYHRFIRVNEACHRLLEPILRDSALSALVPGWRPADRASALALDLRAMGLAPLAALPFAIEQPDPAEAVGIAYVLEGSRLGAGFILSALKRREPSAAWKDASFHYLAGPDAPHALRALLNEAAPVVGDEGALERCVAAANAAFDHVAALEAAARTPAGDAA